MTTYTTIPDTDIDQDSPVTQPLMTALRDNPLAIAECDSTVAAGLRPTVLLGTLTTTSGTTHSLTSLDLQPYKFLNLVFDGVDTNQAATSLQFMSLGIISGVNGAAYGILTCAVADGIGFAALGLNGSAASVQIFDTSLTSASTSITISTPIGLFTAGSIDVYGVK